MKTKENIKSLFNNLKTWIEFPKYQAERRLDVFFGLYLEDILKRCRNELFRKRRPSCLNTGISSSEKRHKQ